MKHIIITVFYLQIYGLTLKRQFPLVSITSNILKVIMIADVTIFQNTNMIVNLTGFLLNSLSYQSINFYCSLQIANYKEPFFYF